MSIEDLQGKPNVSAWVVQADADCDMLYSRIQGCLDIINSDKLDKVDTTQGILLAVQLQAMITYHCILVLRLRLVGIAKEVVK